MRRLPAFILSLLLTGTFGGVVCIIVYATQLYADSAIDDTRPATNEAPVASTPVRGNFSIAKQEITALQSAMAARVSGPNSARQNAVAIFADTTGKAIADAGCALSTIPGFLIPAQLDCPQAFFNIGSDVHSAVIAQNGLGQVFEGRNGSGATVFTVNGAGRMAGSQGLFSQNSASDPALFARNLGTGPMVRLLDKNSVDAWAVDNLGRWNGTLNTGAADGKAAWQLTQTGADLAMAVMDGSATQLLAVDGGATYSAGVTVNIPPSKQEALEVVANTTGTTQSLTDLKIADTSTTATSGLNKTAFQISILGNWSAGASGKVIGLNINAANVGGTSPVVPILATGGISAISEITLGGIAEASLGTPADGTIAYCSDCNKATPCTAGGGGALAKRLNGAWDCD